jgi:formylglycine-generating enzyme required for sulfatase activity
MMRILYTVALMAAIVFSFGACGDGGAVVPKISTATLPDGTVNKAYSQTLAASGDAPITWSIDGGALPAGLILAPTGTVTGTPTAEGTCIFTVKATNAAGFDTKLLTITIEAVPAISTGSLPNGAVGMPYNQTLRATGSAPITWSYDGALPAGLSLAANGIISGNPTAEGTSTFTVKATNAAGIGTRQLSIKIVEPLAEMVQITGGTFTMGSPANELNRDIDETQHSVTLTGFRMGKYPVTQGQYEALMGTNPSTYQLGGDRDQYLDGITDTSNFPVETISWYDALVFCNKLSVHEGLTPAYRISGSTDPDEWGTVPTDDSDARWDAVMIVAGSTGYRLPTEAQWEYACRAGTTTPFNTGENITTDQANYNGNEPYNGNPVGAYLRRTSDVAGYAPNAWGLYDMHGNAFEWCWDWYGEYPEEAQTNPAGPVSGVGRVERGGARSYGAQSLRSAYRSFNGPEFTSSLIGFRLARP